MEAQQVRLILIRRFSRLKGWQMESMRRLHVTAGRVAGWWSLGWVRASAQAECYKLADTAMEQKEQHSVGRSITAVGSHCYNWRTR